ncbi:MAG TPA: enoyl-CoA hydratase-related protein [Pseudomonadales bacterium]|nr:enoyl-CoA hydratase-related protein [Pseudomonadales bacterium]
MSVISCHIDNHIATLTLNNPRVGNALGQAFWQEFPTAVAALQANPDVHVVILKGEGKHFCVGIDLPYAQTLFSGPSDDTIRQRRIDDIKAMQEAFQSLEHLDIPVIAAVHGACIGAGVELASCADIRLCTQDATFALKEIQLAIIPDLGGLQRLPRQMPLGIARELAMTGRNFSAAEAHQWYWVNKTFEDVEGLHHAALQMAQQMAACAPRAMRHIKRSLSDNAIAQDLEGMRALIEPQIDECITVDMFEAMRAMQEKRPANFPPRPTKK